MHLSSQGLAWEAEEVKGGAPCSFINIPVDRVPARTFLARRLNV